VLLPQPELPVLVLPEPLVLVLPVLVLDQVDSRRAAVGLLLWLLSARWVVLVLITLSSSIQLPPSKVYWFLIYVRKKLGIDALLHLSPPFTDMMFSLSLKAVVVAGNQ
jgi:hypothetical protein